jgi:hypothetical protein
MLLMLEIAGGIVLGVLLCGLLYYFWRIVPTIICVSMGAFFVWRESLVASLLCLLAAIVCYIGFHKPVYENPSKIELFYGFFPYMLGLDPAMESLVEAGRIFRRLKKEGLIRDEDETKPSP